MTLYLKRTLDDGATVIGDNHGDSSVPETETVLKPGQWFEVQKLPHDQQRAKLDELREANTADQTGGRTELDEQTMETAANASTGEAHQENERGAE